MSHSCWQRGPCTLTPLREAGVQFVKHLSIPGICALPFRALTHPGSLVMTGFETVECSYPSMDRKLAECWTPTSSGLVRVGVELSLWAMSCPWER